MALNDRIQEVSSQVNQINNRKNTILELDNLLFSQGINKHHITGNDLSRFSIEEFTRIIEVLRLPELDDKITAFDRYREDSSLASRNWLRAMAAVLTGAFKNALIDEDQKVTALKESIATYKRYQAMFRGDDLITPVFDMLEFNNLLIICRMSIADTIEIKFFIGKANIRLVLSKNINADDQNLIQKYQIILNKKQKTYHDDIKAVEELVTTLGITLKLSELENQITTLTEAEPKIPFKSVQNAAVCILLAAELDAFSQNQVATAEQVASLINNAEFLLKISRRHKPKTISDSKTANESDKLIIQAKDILSQEQDFLKSINPDEYERYAQLLAVVDNKKKEDSPEGESYRLAIVLESLRQELKVFEITAAKYEESPELFRPSYMNQAETIRDYLEVYELLKNRMKTPITTEKTVYKIIYLTNPDGKAVITQYIESLSDSYRVSIKNIINSLSNGNLANKETAVMLDEYTIYTIERRNVVLSYILLENNAILVIFAAQKKIDTDHELNKIISAYKFGIKALFHRIKSASETQLLFDEQAKIRSELKVYFGEKKTRKAKAA